MSVQSLFGSYIGRVLVPRPYWAVKLASGKFLTELDSVRDPVTQEMRPFDWALDLFGTSMRTDIKELWLFTPPTDTHLLGQSVFLSVKIPGCLFQFKIGAVYGLGGGGTRQIAQVIGRVDDKVTGDCTCFVYDDDLGEIGLWHTTVYNMGSYREGIAPLGAMEQAILGVSL